MKSAVDVIATIVAAGYVKGEELIADMKQKAQELDASVNISQRVATAYKYSVDKCKKIDKDLAISDTITKFKNQGTLSIYKLTNLKKALKSAEGVYKDIESTLGLEKKLKEAKEGATGLAKQVIVKIMY